MKLKCIEYLPNVAMEHDNDRVDWGSWGYKRPGWYFWDETWSYAHGPYKTEAEARSAVALYAAGLEGKSV